MKRFVCAATVLLVLVSGNIQAEQPGNFNATQANRGRMIVPPSDTQHGAGTSHTLGDKSEQLGAPYYHNTNW